MNSLPSVLRHIPGALWRELHMLTLRGPRARESLKVVLSVLLAVTAATFLELDDLSWAAFSGYMVMRVDFAETFSRGIRRIAGTVGGALVAVLLAPFAADSPGMLMACLFVVSWIGVFNALTSRHPYAWFFFGLTAVLVLTDTLASPELVLHVAATRVAEIVVGTIACLVIASLFTAICPATGTLERSSAPAVKQSSAFRNLWHKDGLQDHWLLVTHSTRAAIAVALLPLVWRWLEVQDFGQTDITSYVVMLVPAAVVHERRHHSIYERMAHRVLGCFLGGAAAIACLSAFSNDLLLAVLALCAGIWLGHQIQMGGEDVGYLGTQFVLVFLVTFVQGPGPVASILPGLERFLGILIGCAMLCLVMLVWRLPALSSEVADHAVSNARRL